MAETFTHPRNAAEWFLVIHASEDPSPETVQAWQHWLDASAENRQAFEEIVDIWHRTPAAVISQPARDSQEEEYDGSIPVAHWRAGHTRPSTPVKSMASASQSSPGQRKRRWVGSFAAAASIAVVALNFTFSTRLAPVSTGEFATRTSEHRRITLADGSTVTLGAHSKLAIDLRPETRELVLEAGEAYFSVAKDPSRPFIVRAMNGSITAIGTEFNVRALEGRVTVTVTEGSVKVGDVDDSRPSSGTLAPSLRLTQGEQITFETQKRTLVADAAKVERVTAEESARWRDGWLVYRNEPLRYVIADISRYTNEQIAVAASAEEVHFSGAVFKSDIDEWLHALATVAPVDVTRVSDGFIISARAQ